MLLQQIFFALVTIYFGYRAFKLFSRIRRNILLGEDEDLTDNAPQRWKNVFLIAFGQKKMFKRMIPAVLHLFIYVAFLFTQLELIEIFIDGFFGVHRFFADKIGFLYPIIISTIEILSFLAMIGTVVFLVGEKVEERSFLFDTSVRVPDNSYLGQVPTFFWIILTVIIGSAEQSRANSGLVNPADVPQGQHGIMRGN